jgi:hypothetical protein
VRYRRDPILLRDVGVDIQVAHNSHLLTAQGEACLDQPPK